MATRTGVNLVWLFDEPLAGRKRPTDELVEALADKSGRFHPRGGGGPRAAYVKPAHRREESLALLRWWTRRVNVLLAAATDVGRFVVAAGNYQPRRHLAFLLSLERLFSGVHQTLVEAGRNETMRLAFRCGRTPRWGRCGHRAAGR